MVVLSVYAPEADGERQLVVKWQMPTGARGQAFTSEYVVHWAYFSGAAIPGVENEIDNNVTVNVTLSPSGNYTYHYKITNLTSCSSYKLNVRAADGNISLYGNDIWHCTKPNSIIS